MTVRVSDIGDVDLTSINKTSQPGLRRVDAVETESSRVTSSFNSVRVREAKTLTQRDDIRERRRTYEELFELPL